MKNRRTISALAVFLIAAAAFAVYWGIFDYPFVFDDAPNILENARIRSLSNFLSPKILIRAREAVDFTFAVNYALGGYGVFGYHLGNVLIHVLNGVVAYFLSLLLLRGMTGRSGNAAEGGDDPARLVSLFTALLFVVHPLQTQAVTYTIQRYTSMAALFYMASILFYLKARFLQKGEPETAAAGKTAPGKGAAGVFEKPAGKKGRQKSRKAVPGGDGAVPKPDAEKSAPGPLPGRKTTFRTVVFFALSVLFAFVAFRSKENTLSLPVAILLAEYFAVDRSRAGWKRKIPWIAAAVAAVAVFYFYTAGLFRPGFSWGRFLADLDRQTRETDAVGRMSYLLTQLNVLLTYLRLLIIPVNQNLDYMYPFRTAFFGGTTPFAFAFLLFLAVAAWLVRRRWPVLSFGVFWFFVTLLVESTIIPIRDALFEHRMYLPLFGCSLAVVWTVFHLLGNRRALAAGLCVILVATLGTASVLRNRVWRDEAVLWSDVVRKNPESVRGLNYLGTLQMERGRLDEAAALLERALRVSAAGGDAITHYNLANVLKKRGDGTGAERHYREALRLDPGYAGAYVNLGNLYRDRGDGRQALDMYEKALKADRFSGAARYGLAALYLREGNYRGAVEQFKALAKADPADAVARTNLASALLETGDETSAIRELDEALRLRPDYGEAHFNLAVIYEKKGDGDRALFHYGKAAASGSRTVPAAHFRAARIHAMKKEADQALLQLEQSFASGFRNWTAVEADGAFASLRSLEQYRELRARYGNPSRDKEKDSSR
jgi:tetratricopeptide (TPR) repeat protein